MYGFVMLAFVSWVLSLSARVKAFIEITPSVQSPLSGQQQLSEWKKDYPHINIRWNGNLSLQATVFQNRWARVT